MHTGLLVLPAVSSGFQGVPGQRTGVHNARRLPTVRLGHPDPSWRGQHGVAVSNRGSTLLDGSSSHQEVQLKPSSGLGDLLVRRGGGSPSQTTALTILSTLVGYVIIAGSMLFKVPQAARIFRKKSAEGISATMYSLETVGIAMSLVFSIRSAFPFSTFGEAFFILAQNMAILAGISIYDQNPKPSVLALGLLVFGALFALTLSPALVPYSIVSLLQSISIPLLNISRIPQILLNHERKSTGELAPSTLILQAAGNLARIFTTIVQVKNQLFLLSCIVAMVFNGILVAQYLMYLPKASH